MRCLSDECGDCGGCGGWDGAHRRCAGGRVGPSGRPTSPQGVHDAAAALELVQAPVDGRRHDAQDDDGGEQAGGVHALALGGQDHAQALAAHGHLPDDRAGDRQGEAGAQSGEDGGQRHGQLHVGDHGGAVGPVEAGGVDDVGVQSAQAEQDGHGDREEDHEDAQHHGRRGAVADPHDQQRGDGDGRNRLRGGDVGKDGAGEQAPVEQGPGQGQGQRGRREAAQGGLGQGHPGVAEQTALAHAQPQAADDVGGAGQEDGHDEAGARHGPPGGQDHQAQGGCRAGAPTGPTDTAGPGGGELGRRRRGSAGARPALCQHPGQAGRGVRGDGGAAHAVSSPVARSRRPGGSGVLGGRRLTPLRHSGAAGGPREQTGRRPGVRPRSERLVLPPIRTFTVGAGVPPAQPAAPPRRVGATGSRTITAGSDFHRPRSTLLPATLADDDEYDNAPW